MNIYGMSLHEMRVIPEIGEDITILRVPGGWIYYRKNTSCFVPFHHEFYE